LSRSTAPPARWILGIWIALGLIVVAATKGLEMLDLLP
jgi:hypothetical protein